MAIQTLSQAFNPITGVFGTGQVQVFGTSGSWTVPTGISRVRARVWGGGGTNYGSGGGFSLRAIYDLTGVTSVAVTVGAAAGTSSFGSYCSATGGGPTGQLGGVGSGGDINYSGGRGYNVSSSGGGVASLFGDGGAGATALNINGGNGASGGGAGTPSAGSYGSGGNGFLGAGGFYNPTSATGNYPPSTGLLPVYSIDFIGTGGGGAHYYPGVNGGGGGSANSSGAGGFPGGGGGGNAPGGKGLVIVEW